jgi:hypothetical protein
MRTPWRAGDFEAIPNAGHIVIHAVVDARGRLALPDGKPLPRLQPGSAVRIRALARNLVERPDRALLTRPESLTIAPPGTVLFAIIDLRSTVNPSLGRRLEVAGRLPTAIDAREFARTVRKQKHPELRLLEDDLSPSDGLFAVEMEEELTLERRGVKPFRLRNSRCKVPALFGSGSGEPGDPLERCSSINQALTRLSERFELHRSTHTHNAFMRLLLPVAPGRRELTRLMHVRDELAAAIAFLKAVTSGAHDALDLYKLLEEIETAVKRLDAAGLLVGDIEALANSAINRWADVESKTPL